MEKLSKEEGLKFDQEKTARYDLIPRGPLKLVAEVLARGARKYKEHNWLHVENARVRYYNATVRHLEDWRGGEKNDRESGLPHLAHAACNVFFLLALELRDGDKEVPGPLDPS
jgi:hypothetical protein